MKYNEKQFATSANKKATLMWVVMSAVLSAAYVIEIIKGLKTVEYFLLMEICYQRHTAGSEQDAKAV